MNSAKKALIFFLGLLAFKDAMLGLSLLFNLQWLLKLAGLNYSEDVKIMASFFGVCVLIVSTLCIAAIRFVLQGNTNGIFLAKFTGFWMIIASIIVFIKIGKPAWSAIDFISGVLIVIPAYMYARQMKMSV